MIQHGFIHKCVTFLCCFKFHFRKLLLKKCSIQMFSELSKEVVSESMKRRSQSSDKCIFQPVPRLRSDAVSIIAITFGSHQKVESIILSVHPLFFLRPTIKSRVIH